MMRVRPCPVWPEQGKEMDGFACKFMHAMHAVLFTRRLVRKKGLRKKKDRPKKSRWLGSGCAD